MSVKYLTACESTVVPFICCGCFYMSNKTIKTGETFKSKQTDTKSVGLGVIYKIQTTGLQISTSALSEDLRTNREVK